MAHRHFFFVGLLFAFNSVASAGRTRLTWPGQLINIATAYVSGVFLRNTRIVVNYLHAIGFLVKIPTYAEY